MWRSSHFVSRATSSAAAALAYQFFENQWVHPFLGAGIEAIREVDRLEVQLLQPGVPQPPGVPLPPVLIPETQIRYTVRPFVTGGVKWYVSERAFIRSDILTTLSSDGAESVVWRAGVGVDF